MSCFRFGCLPAHTQSGAKIKIQLLRIHRISLGLSVARTVMAIEALLLWLKWITPSLSITNQASNRKSFPIQSLSSKRTRWIPSSTGDFIFPTRHRNVSGNCFSIFLFQSLRWTCIWEQTWRVNLKSLKSDWNFLFEGVKASESEWFR